MKFAGNSIDLTCTLVLTEREVKMLAWLAGYGGEPIARAIAEKLTKEYSAEEWEKLWSDMRIQLEDTKTRFEDVKAVFRGTKVAKRIERPE